MYKKIIFHKTSTDDVQTLNDRIRSEISDFLQANGWTLTTKGNSYNIVLSKDYSNQDSVLVEDTFWAPHHGSSNANYSNTLVSISRHSTNGRILTMLNGENPKTRSYDPSITVGNPGYVTGYNDTYDNYGQYSGVDYYGRGFPSMSVRLDDLIEEATLEMYYFTDSDTQEEFYIVIKTDKIFGRMAPTDSQFYQTLMFAKIPGIPMLSCCTFEDNVGLMLPYATNIKGAFQVRTTSNGVKYIPEWQGPEIYSGTTFWNGLGCNMGSEPADGVNPRFDAPDSTDNLWLHLAHFRCLNGLGINGDGLDSLGKYWPNNKYPWGIWNVTFYSCFREEMNGVQVWDYNRTLGYFNSYEFLHQQGVSSELGGSVLCPIAKLHLKGKKHEIRHSKRYSVYHTKPESVILSDTYKCYPTLRRSVMGYSNYTSTNIGNPTRIINPTNPNEYVGIECSRFAYHGNGDTATKGWYFTEEYLDGRTQPVLKSAWVGEEIDASGYEGFALDYTDYDVNNVSEVDLRSNP